MDLMRIAFLETYTFEENPGDRQGNPGIMGAIIVTDPDTKPIEFRVTAPIKPTNFQKTLYGNVLREHVLVELIALPLLNAIKDEIDIILVRDPLFLGVNNKQGTRAVRLFTDPDETSVQKKGKDEQKTLSGDNGLVYIETSKKFQNELPEIIEKLNPISSNRNLIEPFERLKIACEQVHLQKVDE